MKKLFIFTLMLVAALYFVACGNDNPSAPEPDEIDLSAPDVQAELLARELLVAAGWDEDAVAEPPSGHDLTLQTPLHGHLSSFERQVITGNIVHYSFRIPVGPGEHDVIGIHRVVKETAPFRPIKTDNAVFFQHGDFAAFEAVYMPGSILSSKADDFGIAIYLAENDVDVWGIDQAWTLVPGGTSDLGFMMDWGLQRQIDDLGVALMVARFTRHLTGNGLAKMLLSGYSSGSATGYSFLNDETQKPLLRRQVGGYISVDMAIKTDLPDFAQIWATRATDLLAKRATGVAQDDDVFLLAATLARIDPDGTSPIAPALGLPPLTNMQIALFLATAPIFGAEPHPFHYVTGVWDETGLPVGLAYMTMDQLLDFMQALAPYEPLLFEAELAALMGDAVDSPFDDHLSEIDVPVLNIGGGGGFGVTTTYTTTLLGSTDITHNIVELLPGQVLFDFAHVEIILADESEALIWQPMLGWIESH